MFHSAGSLPSIDVAPRERQVHDALEQNKLGAIIITTPANVRWLTGFAGSNALVTVVDGHITLFTDARYADRAPDEVHSVNSSADVVIERAALGEAVRAAVGPQWKVGLEAEHVSWAQQQRIATDWLPQSELVATTAVVTRLRAHKDHAEMARIQAAAGIVDDALAAVRDQLGNGLTEIAFARLLDAAIRRRGADDVGFETIVAAGPNAAVPHHTPGEREISHGDLVIVDVGALVDGYRSDMTRTFCIGEMSDDQQRHYDTVVAAQQAGFEAMVDGAATAAVDAAARQVITEAGWADSFTHGTGHGIGLDIHELPRVSKDATDHYRIGTVATIEPGVYLRGQGGVRIEDTCVVAPSGARRMTMFPKDQAVIV